MRYFDYEKMAHEAGITQEQIEELCASIRQEFPNDEIMYELHVLRACMAVRDGNASLDDVLQTREVP